jgi:hypothetical protein
MPELTSPNTCRWRGGWRRAGGAWDSVRCRPADPPPAAAQGTGREGRHSSPLGRGGRLAAVLAVAVLALILIVPSFTRLYLLDQKSMLKEEGVSD